MTTFQTIVIGIVEGLTEFLPVSSTGHMIIAEKLLGVESSEFVNTFTVAIQFGAILSVLVLYWKRFLQSLNFYYKLLVGFIPAAIFGFLFNDKLDKLLNNVLVVASMLVVGGIVMLFVDKWFNKPKEDQEMTYKNAFIIGCFQCLAMIPGVSRSMSTIVGGMTRGLTRKNAAEFSFFLAVPTMAAATGYKLLKLYLSDGATAFTGNGNMQALILGNVVAFIVAILAIKFFIAFVTKYGFKLFGWYRIVVGFIILVLIWQGVITSVV